MAIRIGVLGTGTVGATLATRLVELGHEVMMGARQAGGEKAVAWVRSAGGGASEGSFADAAHFGEVVLNATSGMHSVEALQAAGAEALRGKVLIDVANPLVTDAGFPPTLGICNDDSLGERIQRAFPEARVVKTLNTVNCAVMVQPSLVPGDHNLFVSGNDADAKAQVVSLLGELGWPRDSVLDLGDISSARGPEMLMALWLRLVPALGTPHLNLAVHH